MSAIQYNMQYNMQHDLMSILVSLIYIFRTYVKHQVFTVLCLNDYIYREVHRSREYVSLSRKFEVMESYMPSCGVSYLGGAFWWVTTFF
jgi:hypothetical protein